MFNYNTIGVFLITFADVASQLPICALCNSPKTCKNIFDVLTSPDSKNLIPSSADKKVTNFCHHNQ